MLKIKIANWSAEEMIGQLSACWGGAIVSGTSDQSLQFAGPYGSGEIRFLNTDLAFTHVKFDLKLMEETELSIGNLPFRPYYLLVCPLGSIKFRSPREEIVVNDQKRLFYLSDESPQEESLFFKNVPTELSIIRIADLDYKNTLIDHVAQMIKNQFTDKITTTSPYLLK